jgi:hypothetical protein
MRLRSKCSWPAGQDDTRRRKKTYSSCPAAIPDNVPYAEDEGYANEGEGDGKDEQSSGGVPRSNVVSRPCGIILSSTGCLLLVGCPYTDEIRSWRVPSWCAQSEFLISPGNELKRRYMSKGRDLLDLAANAGSETS